MFDIQDGKDKRINIRVTEKERIALKELSEKRQMSVSNFLRSLINKEMEVEETNGKAK